ncbi:hypothetical protein AM493_10090 [Flavobacterium akiainvivens]|uniref:Lipoprotein n=1 Tax=Flavobacterium akiainvivens TaxID=1202724 RepID=A0A0M8M9H8_9FLAO|nr:hypothetical protein [Flavobacterium akiainvivens]KOS06343.1 hypothetical protein AM493_10090 [Flavobacterium akiainvivens]SFQ15750.1 hypothetical protein SAMN05444144_101345 [Flavobacterium akiainvivens]
MKKLLIIFAITAAFASCKDKDPNTTTVTTEEKTTVDTIDNRVRTETKVTHTTETDTTKSTITGGDVNVESQEQNAKRLKQEKKKEE